MVDSDMLESESCTVSVGGGSPGDGGGGTTTEREREETLGEGGCWRGKLSESTLSRESGGRGVCGGLSGEGGAEFLSFLRISFVQIKKNGSLELYKAKRRDIKSIKKSMK